MRKRDCPVCFAQGDLVAPQIEGLDCEVLEGVTSKGEGIKALSNWGRGRNPSHLGGDYKSLPGNGESTHAGVTQFFESHF